MKVTRIQQQVKRPDRYSIYVDDKYLFSLSDYQLVGSGVIIGAEYTQQQLDALVAESSFGKAYERTLNYVMIRPRSEKEIREYLTRTCLYPKPKSYSNKAGERVFKKVDVNKPQTLAMIDRVLARLVERKYIDDQRFAAAWVRSRMLTKRSSKRRLEQELYTKGIASNIIATVLQNEYNDEAEVLAELVEKKRKLSRYQDDTKLTQYLLRQGFNYDDIKSALAPDD